ncbi:MAG: SUMF1/EgtB/PvdO family nonheme iron enzyme [Thermoguttaceae bacterium]|nr:SUMF1/EgtB/PvdO family nonheme iron enzyme [Thermoguttaceae bacterium]
MPRELLAIGVGDYDQDSVFRRLPKAASDVALMAACFGNSLPEESRFHSQIMINPRADEATEAIEEILEKLDANSVFILYFAGHAIQERGNKRQWLLCKNALACFANGNVGTGAISSEYFNDSLARRGKGKIFSIIDACREDPTYDKGLGVELTGMDQFGNVEQTDRTVSHKRTESQEDDAEYQSEMFTLYACQPRKRARDGVFARALNSAVLKRVKKGAEVRLDDAFVADVTNLVQEVNPDQKPCKSTTTTDFVLVPGARKSSDAETIAAGPKPSVSESQSPPSRRRPSAQELTESANAALQAGNYKESERLALAALELDGSFGWAIWVRDEARRRREKLEAEERRRREEQESRERRSRELDEALNEGWLSLSRGDVANAFEQAEIVLKERPTDGVAIELKRQSEAALESSGAMKWSASTRRKAGTRQTLEIGSEEYGFCWIPAGEFDMGSPSSEEERDDDETLHHVKLTKGFWMLETPVTQSLYEEVMKENPSHFKGGNLPVECVSWDEANEFCEELTKRLPSGLRASLPTEAQWEYSCRAGTKTAFSFGNELNGDQANCDGNYPYGSSRKGKYLEKTSPVKSYDPNACGLYDMHGNVWEWVLDYYGDYPTGTVVDPKGPDTASSRVIRGGGWGNSARYCRSANRYWRTPDIRNYRLGFRFLLSCD